MSFGLCRYSIDPIAEASSRTPREEKILTIWNQIDKLRKVVWRDSLISMSEYGLDGAEDQDKLFSIEVTEDGRIMVEIELTANVIVDLEKLMTPSEECTILRSKVIQLFKELELVDANLTN